jgi:UDP-N-acetylmuramoylalanine--D-glutamate ligase
MDLRRKRILVVGLARTGIAAARFLHQRGAIVVATDHMLESRLDPAIRELAEMGIGLELGGHRPESFTAADFIVLSPGVPHTIAPLAAARQRGVPVIGEMELAFRFIAEPIVAITGTNGKTTVTELVGAMLAASGRRVFVGGNIGTPLISHAADGGRVDVVVVEISSFQLDTIETFRPAVGVLLNITDDHLDRYADFETYAASKMRLFANRQSGDVAILNADDPIIRDRANGLRDRVLYFSRSEPATAYAAIAGRTLTLRMPGRETIALGLDGFRLRGPHNLENAAAAALAALAAGGTSAGLQTVLNTFAPRPHRLETIASVNGVEYVNDSKATNVDAVRRGLESFSTPIVLIMGGVDKGGDFGLLRDLLRERGRGLVMLGGARQRIRAALEAWVPTAEAAGMRQAVRAAAALAAAGDVVLLAPGCASFDLYANYQERGEDFRREVMRLMESDG